MPRFTVLTVDPELREKAKKDRRILWSVGSGFFLLGLGLGVTSTTLFLSGAVFWVYLVMVTASYFAFVCYINVAFQVLSIEVDFFEIPPIAMILYVLLAIVQVLWRSVEWPYIQIRWRLDRVPLGRDDLKYDRGLVKTDFFKWLA